MRRLTVIGLFVFCMIIFAACASGGGREAHEGEIEPANETNHVVDNENRPQEEQDQDETDREKDEQTEVEDHQELPPVPPEPNVDDEVEAREALKAQYDITDPTSIAVLVNKEYGLPDGYEPDDLVKPDIPFVYEYEDVHYLRQEAAEALIQMFEASKEDGIELAGVSGYRSYAIQKTLYENYVKRDGEKAANRYSAKPGHSEHSTGLAMDVAGISGKCAANNCFADTEEAIWVADNAHKFGFIIRYPLGKEEITGYQYEPWHLRYVGKELAALLQENEWTMEEFFLDSELTGES